MLNGGRSIVMRYCEEDMLASRDSEECRFLCKLFSQVKLLLMEYAALQSSIHYYLVSMLHIP